MDDRQIPKNSVSQELVRADAPDLEQIKPLDILLRAANQHWREAEIWRKESEVQALLGDADEALMCYTKMHICLARAVDVATRAAPYEHPKLSANKQTLEANGKGFTIELVQFAENASKLKNGNAQATRQ